MTQEVEELKKKLPYIKKEHIINADNDERTECRGYNRAIRDAWFHLGLPYKEIPLDL